jgi:hypothetical protein
MGRNDRTSAPPPAVQKEVRDKPIKPRPLTDADDDVEDGDIATPKRDRTGNDDEPL